MSRELLGTGAEGYGYLLAGLGVGGLLAAPLVTWLERQRGWGRSSGSAWPATAFRPCCCWWWTNGLGVLRAGVQGWQHPRGRRAAVTRAPATLSGDLLQGRVFGAFEGLMTLAILLGSLLVPVGLALVGIDGVIVFSGLVIPLLCLAGPPGLRRLDRESSRDARSWRRGWRCSRRLGCSSEHQQVSSTSSRPQRPP